MHAKQSWVANGSIGIETEKPLPDSCNDVVGPAMFDQTQGSDVLIGARKRFFGVNGFTPDMNNIAYCENGGESARACNYYSKHLC